MKTWYSKNIGDGVEANAPSAEIQKTFLPLFAAAGMPVGMAVLSRYDLELNVVTVYFTPDSQELAKIFDAEPCEMPKNENRLGLLAGSAGAMDHFYSAS